MVDAMNERDFRTMYAVYKEMVAEGVKLDARTFNILIEAAGRARRVDIMYAPQRRGPPVVCAAAASPQCCLRVSHVPAAATS